MPSGAYKTWTTTRKGELNKMEWTHRAIGGTKRGRRYATEHVNQAYVVAVASQFQGYCRDLHTESVDHVVQMLIPPNFQAPVRTLLTQKLELKRSNAQPDSIGKDFNRFGIDFWTEVIRHDPHNEVRKTQLWELNALRNAIVHQDFTSSAVLRLQQVKKWRRVCERLAQSFDEVMRHYLQNLTGRSPW
jgi:hypothetical protein